MDKDKGDKPNPKATKRRIEIFCRYIRKNGKIIYPKNGKCFHFFIEVD